MPKIPDGLKEEFLALHPKANAETLAEAAQIAGAINGGITQLRGLYARHLLENGGHTAEPTVRQVFPDEGRKLIQEYYDEEDHA